MFTRRKQEGRSRVSFIVLTLLLIVAIISGCGAPATNNKEGVKGNATVEPSPTATTEAPAEETKQFKTIKTINGDIEVPVNPIRIVAEEYLGTLIALGVVPVGAPGLTIKNYYFKEALAKVADIGDYSKPSIENIIALSPDLILTGVQDNYAQLSKIAPTVVIPYGDLKNTHDELTYFGTLFNKEAEAKAWLAQFDERIAAAKAKVDAVIPADATFTIFEDGGKQTWAYGDNFGRGGQPIYQALGRKPPTEVAAEIMEKQWAEITAELLPKYAGDYLIVTSNTRTVEDFKADPIWGSLPAVKNGNIYVWKEEVSWYYDPLAVLAQTEELTEWLTTKK
ncbi:ABC transporter substrate-binding protein [Paenibacillus sp. GSMTC-2017]|uniref:ABC transporter substrate-binding protein n=1 Tax=Paenibacillus sp. GSMTC-2017 TaxID=2794350 RepID=UPI0018D8E34B|nr:ABC transporter substrate-binding protein [Paenibacillus sp. GSMTC-2017]MBH5318831.1 ABC transporter substrate-binding protein [Paenibacillus sp. GSMTC-2017]